MQGEERHVSLICGFDLLDDGTYFRVHGAMVDVTLRRLARAAAERLANTDELTGLPSRRHFLETVRKELARSARFDKPLCMAMIDIDDFQESQ